MDVELVRAIAENPPISAIELVKLVKKFVGNDTESIVKTITLIAAGTDGISGTSDDLIPLDVIDTVKVLLTHQVVRELADELIAASSSKCWCFN